MAKPDPDPDPDPSVIPHLERLEPKLILAHVIRDIFVLPPHQAVIPWITG
ncbi:MAG: hypothetical protein O2832_05725 [Proteobacteria bacterium]|nr:hypothetical protein [Pseudomonadota bacterium]